MQHFTLMLDSSLLLQLMIFNLSDYVTTASELWATSPSTSSIYSSTSQYSDEPLSSYSHLLDYTPSSIDQPQPSDAILVPRECNVKAYQLYFKFVMVY